MQKINRLSATAVSKLNAKGFYPDGAGLKRIEFITMVDLEGLPLVTTLELPPGTTRQ